MSIRIAGQVIASAGSLTAHNEDPNAHPDIRELIGQGGGGGGGYSKEEIDNKFTVVDTAILGNADAIQKTRSDFMESDSELQQQINAHAEELTTQKNDIDELGDQVASIESKIPEGTSDTNPLINKQQLLDEEMDIREDMMESDSELQTQINALAEAVQGGGGGSAEIPDNVYTEDNLVGGENISFAKESSYDANTISLYHFEGNSNDEITGEKMLNDSALSGAENKFGTGSLGLIEDTISVGALSKTINPKTTSFTMEFWHKFVAGTTAGRYGEETSVIFMPTEQTNPGWKTNWIGMYMLPDGNYNTIKIQIGESRLGDFSTASLTTVGSWNHYAFVWDVTTTTFKIYMNGKLGGTYEYGSTDWLETFGYVGAFKYTTGSESLTTARMYIDELRVSDTIRYTGEFEVATKAFEGSEAKTKVNAVLPEGLYTQDSLIAGKNVTFTEVPPAGGIDSHTKALWHFDGDKIDVVNGIEIIGQDTTINTSKSKFGSACLKQPERTYYWTSSSSYCADISSLSLSTENDITVDFWLNLNYRTSSSYAGGTKEFFAFNASSLNFGAFWLWDDANKLIKFGDLQNQTEYSQEISISAYGQWHHVAYAYKSQERKSFIYFDGVKIKESDVPNLQSATLTKFNFWRDNKNYQPENCIDEARISDIVRYDEDFTPPTEPYKIAEGPSKTAVNASVAVPTKTSELENDSGFLDGLPDNVYTQTNLLGGKDIEIAPEPAVVVAYSYVPYTSGYGSGPFPELLYSSVSSIEQGVTINYYTDIELTDLYGSTSGYTNSSGRLVLRSGSTAKCEMRLLEGTPVEKSTGNMVVNYVEKQNIDYVVESYSDEDGNWYRVWKSGWLEQGGSVEFSSEISNFSVSYLRAFSAVRNVILQKKQNQAFANNTAQANIGSIVLRSDIINTVSNTGFNISFVNADSNSLPGSAFWYACGQGA